jgi:hypothetical protein
MVVFALLKCKTILLYFSGIPKLGFVGVGIGFVGVECTTGLT